MAKNMFRSRSVGLTKEMMTIALKKGGTAPLLRPYSSSPITQDFWGKAAQALLGAPKVAKIEPASVKAENKPEKRTIARAVPQVSTLNRAKAEEHEQLLALRTAQKEADIPSESVSSVVEKVSKAYQYKYGLAEVSSVKLVDIIVSASTAPMHMKMKQRLLTVMEKLKLSEALIESVLKDPFLLGIGNIEGLIPVARLDDHASTTKIISSMKLWATRYWIGGEYFPQVSQVDSAAKYGLECLFERKNIIAVVDDISLKTENYIDIGSGYRGSEGDELEFKAALFKDASGKLQIAGCSILSEQLKAGVALRQVQTKVKAGLTLLALEDYLRNEEEPSLKASKGVLDHIGMFMKSDYVDLNLPMSANDDTKLKYQACKQLVDNINLHKALSRCKSLTGGITSGVSTTVFKDLDCSKLMSEHTSELSKG